MLDHHDHDHEACQSRALSRAEDQCAARGLRLTAQRRQVLETMLASHAPVTAYEIMDRIAVHARRPSPISVYRALDFLVANGFAHRIESRNAFLACNQDHADAAGAAGHGPVFLLCETCGAAEEAEPAALAALFADVAAATGFTITASVLEMRGLCAACRRAGRLPSPAALPTDQHEDHP